MPFGQQRGSSKPSISPSPSPAPRPEPGKHLHVPKYRPFRRCRDLTAYQQLNKVGQGTFGEVFKAKDKQTGEMVALKKVLMKNEQEGFPITALREIKIMMLLDHVNVLHVKEIVQTAASDFNKQQGSIYLVFEFLDHDLGGLLNRGVEFKAAEIMCMSKQILTGMHYIHTNKILHRDMKVANILMSSKGVLKIADFGLARGCDAKSSKYTGTVCTRWYRPPEILLGERNYSTAIDIWGVGCIVAELFVGRPILQGGGPDMKTEKENDIDQYLKICELCGTPSTQVWKGFDSLPAIVANGDTAAPEAKQFAVPKQVYKSTIATRFGSKMRGVKSAVLFIETMLQLDPERRPTAEKALDHDFLWGFGNEPNPAVLPCKPEEIQKWPSSHEWTITRTKPLNRQPKPAKYAHRPQGEKGGKHVPDRHQQSRPGPPGISVPSMHGTKHASGGVGNKHHASIGKHGTSHRGGGGGGGQQQQQQQQQQQHKQPSAGRQGPPGYGSRGPQVGQGPSHQSQLQHRPGIDGSGHNRSGKAPAVLPGAGQRDSYPAHGGGGGGGGPRPHHFKQPRHNPGLGYSQQQQPSHAGDQSQGSQGRRLVGGGRPIGGGGGSGSGQSAGPAPGGQPSVWAQHGAGGAGVGSGGPSGVGGGGAGASVWASHAGAEKRKRPDDMNRKPSVWATDKRSRPDDRGGRH